MMEHGELGLVDVTSAKRACMNFTDMNNSHTEFTMGREPNEMSCPAASTHDGISLSCC